MTVPDRAARDGICATAGCRLPAQPGRDACSECIRRRIAEGAASPAPDARRCLDCDAPIGTGGNNQRRRCDACGKKRRLALHAARRRTAVKPGEAEPAPERVFRVSEGT